MKSSHECPIPPPPDELLEYIPGQDACSRIRRYMRRLCLISDKHPQAMAVFKSSAAIAFERTAQLKENYYMIHPFSPFRSNWEFVMIGVLILSLLLIPLHIAYSTVSQDNFYMFSEVVILVIDFMCLCDILINFFTGYFNTATEDVVLDFWIVSRIYFRGLFVIDLVSSLPYDVISEIIFEVKHDTTEIVYTRLLILIKVFRIKSLFVYLKNLLARYDLPLVFTKVLKAVFAFILSIHWMSCLQYIIPLVVYIGRDQDRIKSESWVTERELWFASTGKKYLACCYRTMSLFFNIGYGYGFPKTEEDLLYAALCLLFGAVAQVFIIALVLQLSKVVNASSVKYQEMVVQLREYMRHKQLPADLQKKILDYYEFRFQKSYFREAEILNVLSGQLRQDVMLHSCRRLVENVTFFNNLPTNLLVRIVTCLRSEIYLANDVIIKAGTIGDCMFFIATGTVAVYSPIGVEVCHLEDGAHFGEIALVVEGDRRTASVVAVQPSEVFRLDRKDFLRVVSPFPDLLEKLEQIAVERMEKTMHLDEENRRYQTIKAMAKPRTTPRTSSLSQKSTRSSTLSRGSHSVTFQLRGGEW